MPSPAIAVVDYGVANLGSIFNMLRKIGVAPAAVTGPDDVVAAEKIILPGIGAFDNGVTALDRLGLIEPLQHKATVDRTPLLGICLGMQLLGNKSEEGELEGLGLIDGSCVKFALPEDGSLKVPHMGWNTVSFRRDDPLVADLDGEPRFYFVHSYHLRCNDDGDVLATATHGIEFTAMVHRGNVYGAQFHPEKSHRFGMTLLRNFVAL